jgi:hypothetical protein
MSVVQSCHQRSARRRFRTDIVDDRHRQFYNCSMPENEPISKPAPLSPSAFMRDLRPEYYSDSQGAITYQLDDNSLRFKLDTITEQNETHEFEIFCRKLCERVICPNLKPQTGPEGGGDSKADAETYSVSEDVTRLWFVGDADAGKERWAFAFSAKKTWSEKVRKDVQGLIDTKRGYSKIICVTSRPARAKDRARIEDELTKKHGVRVEIFDRSWIVKEIVEADRKDIAFNYLGVGQLVADPFALGPEDYSRKRQLAALETALSDPEAFDGMETQRATEALLAAKLSRNIELPRIETDGRFERAIRLADAGGTERQQFEVRYEKIWTGFWWFDDVAGLNAAYDDFVNRVLPSEHVKNIEFVSNIHQLLFNAVIHGSLTAEEAKLFERSQRLQETLEPLARNPELPNSSLEARTLLLLLRVNLAIVQGTRDALTDVWIELSEVVKSAKGLGEFDADRLVMLVENFGPVAGPDPAYNELIEEVADFVTDRKGEAEGAVILLSRAAKLDFEQRFEMIRLLGKAVRKLSKKEYSDQLIDALQQLSLAYRSAGLFWAARASAVFACGAIVIESEAESELRVEIIPTLMVWAWISLDLKHFPEFITAIQILRGCEARMDLTDGSLKRVQKNLNDLDLAFAAQLSVLDSSDLQRVASLPDVLDGLGLFLSRTALLYVLGHEDALRADGSLPPEETHEAVHKMMSRLGSETLRRKNDNPVILNVKPRQDYRTSVLGLTIQVETNASDVSAGVAESILGTLEALLATALELRILPHTERFDLQVTEVEGLSKPVFTVDNVNMTGDLRWPTSLATTSFAQREVSGDAIFKVVINVLTATCMIPDTKDTLKRLFEGEAVLERISAIASVGTSHHRFLGSYVTRLSEWDELEPTTFEVRPGRPNLVLTPPPYRADDDDDNDGPAVGPEHVGNGPTARSHRAVTVKSVVNVHLWNEAKWKATLYAGVQSSAPVPPIMAFAFTNLEPARQIFQQWHERFGANDEEDEIYIGIVRGVSRENPHHYTVIVSTRFLEKDDIHPNSNFIITNRFMTMTPKDSTNLERFLADYARAGDYGLAPAIWTGSGQPDLLVDLTIGKRLLVVRDAADVKEGEIEYIAISDEERARRNGKA